MADITSRIDDIDKTPEAARYLIVNPADGKTYRIDLAQENFDKLVAALKPFLDHATLNVAAKAEPEVEVTYTKPAKEKTERAKSGYTALDDEQKKGFQAWMKKGDPNWKWSGMPSKEDVKNFLNDKNPPKAAKSKPAAEAETAAA